MSGVERTTGGLTVDGQRRGLGPPLLLEFVGLPGAGKTTIATRLTVELRARGITCSERRGEREADARMTRRIRRAGFLLRNHHLTIACLRFGASVHPVSLTRLTRALKLAGWGRQLGSFAASDVDVVVLDQGPVQDAWSVTVPGRRWSEVAMRGAVGRLIRTVDIPRAFVYVDVDIDTACGRLQQRLGASSRFDRRSPAQTRIWLARYQRSLSSVFQYAVAVADAPVLLLDGGLPVEEQCREVAHFIDAARGARDEWLSPATVVAEDAP